MHEILPPNYEEKAYRARLEMAARDLGFKETAAMADLKREARQERNYEIAEKFFIEYRVLAEAEADTLSREEITLGRIGVLLGMAALYLACPLLIDELSDYINDELDNAYTMVGHLDDAQREKWTERFGDL